MYKHVALLINWVLTFGFCYVMQPSWIILGSPILHFLAFWVTPYCYEGHCKTNNHYDECVVCGTNQWIRMHHCYYCNSCVHKYDHHCVLLGICIG